MCGTCDMGRKKFFCRTHFFSYPPPLGGGHPRKKISQTVSKKFFLAPLGLPGRGHTAAGAPAPRCLPWSRRVQWRVYVDARSLGMTHGKAVRPLTTACTWKGGPVFGCPLLSRMPFAPGGVSGRSGRRASLAQPAHPEVFGPVRRARVVGGGGGGGGEGACGLAVPMWSGVWGIDGWRDQCRGRQLAGRHA